MNRTSLQPVAQLHGDVRKIRFVLTDIDDTLTDEGKLAAETYAALWELYTQGFIIIPVTGRPAGWCDMIIRQWPVHAVVGENGAFVYYGQQDEGVLRIKTLYHPEIAKQDPQQQLLQLRDKVLAEIPGTRIARDQPGRQFDLAIDFREDPPDLGFDVAEQIKDLCEAEGAMAKVSSIHVNAWYGNYDKLSMTKLFFDTQFGLSEEDICRQVIFCGDSPNDQPMFEFFPYSCGVANVMSMIDHISSPPSYVTNKAGGAGFVELAEILLGH